MRAAKVQASLRICAVSPEPSLLAHTSSETRGTFRQKARSLAPLNGWACSVKICHDGMLEDTNSLDGAHLSSDASFINGHFSRLMTKPTKWHVRPAKTQISLGIHPVWSESSLCAEWVAKDPSFLHADREDSGQTGRIPRLIESSLGAHGILLVLSWEGLMQTWQKTSSSGEMLKV